MFNELRLNPYLIGLSVGSTLVAAYELLAYINEVEATNPVALAWPVLFVILLSLWVMEDSKTYPEIKKPFDYGSLIPMFTLVYLPYYLWRSRGLEVLPALHG